MRVVSLSAILLSFLGLDSDRAAPEFADAFRFHCNFIKPHMSLDGKTPAEAAGLLPENGNHGSP